MALTWQIHEFDALSRDPATFTQLEIDALSVHAEVDKCEDGDEYCLYCRGVCCRSMRKIAIGLKFGFCYDGETRMERQHMLSRITYSADKLAHTTLVVNKCYIRVYNMLTAREVLHLIMCLEACYDGGLIRDVTAFIMQLIIELTI